MLRIWDLIKGRCSYHHILEAVADVVAFSPSGSLYALVSGSKVTVHKIGQEAGLVGELSHPRRVLCLAWHQDDVLLTGTEAGSIHAWDVSSSAQICEQVQAHQTRLRGLLVDANSVSQDAPSQAEVQLPPPQVQLQCTVASAASDGTIKTWQFSSDSQADGLQPLSEVSTGARLTCLSLIKPHLGKLQAGKQNTSKAKKRDNRMFQAAEGGIANKNRKLVPGSDKKQPVSAPKPSLQTVGVAKDGVIDFIVAEQPSGQADVKSAAVGKIKVKRRAAGGQKRKA